ncbi:hypothetical protein MgSA37_04130 [Mucilaginibacter gotjawali]|uniref:Uncharacterized protein n=2 Tax=Mucilaginibacter gotjawali TaxID=1550579 RepID=A0A0X8X6I8_9SPHI|nr:hypothetical protein [Mucilaginibacter gotjawali]BAU55938.1 hypothetical protein MgSA37_04130 [Mucilaginibacter gotjawali]
MSNTCNTLQKTNKFLIINYLNEDKFFFIDKNLSALLKFLRRSGNSNIPPNLKQAASIGE